MLGNFETGVKCSVKLTQEELKEWQFSTVHGRCLSRSPKIL